MSSMDLSSTDVGTFLSSLNSVFKLGLTEQQIQTSTAQLQEQWFTMAIELKNVDQSIFQYVGLPKPLESAIYQAMQDLQGTVYTPRNTTLAAMPASSPARSSTTNIYATQSFANMDTSGRMLPALPTATSPRTGKAEDEKKATAAATPLLPPKLPSPTGRSNSVSGPEGGGLSGVSYSYVPSAARPVTPLQPAPVGESPDGDFQLSADDIGDANDDDDGSDGDDMQGAANEEKQQSKGAGHSLLALKKAVEHVCAQPVPDKKVVQNLQNIIKQAMSRSNQVTAGVLRDHLKRLQTVMADIIEKESLQPLASPRGLGMEEHEEKKFTTLSPSAGVALANQAQAMCPLCGGQKDKAFKLECGHSFDTSCVRDYINERVGRQQAVGMKCPLETCGKELSTANIQSLLHPEEFESYLQATLMAFIEQDDNTLICPNPKCKSIISIEPLKNKVPPSPMTEKDDDGRPLTNEAWLHFAEFRVRCRQCNFIFCAQCKTAPYHKGYTCQQFKEYKNARHCRFCSNKLDESTTWRGGKTVALRDVCIEEDCVAKAQQSCVKVLQCGCPCGGVRDEKTCLPCLKHELDIADDYCPICYCDSLGSAPAIKSEGTCSHVFHRSCIAQKIEQKWPGARISFEFRSCPLCKQNVSHPSLTAILAPILELEKVIIEKAVSRLKYEGRDKDPAIINKNGEFYNDPVRFAMKQYVFHVCFKCQKPYFAGGYQCAEANASFDPSELVCPGCQPHSIEDCRIHGKDWLSYKCRYCCSVGSWYCIAEGQRVSLASGSSVRIENLTGKETVLSANVEDHDHHIPLNGQEEKIIALPSVGVYDRGLSSVMEINVDGGRSLVCTPAHEVFTKRGWVRADELEPSRDVIACGPSFEVDDREGLPPAPPMDASFPIEWKTLIDSRHLLTPRRVYDLTVPTTHNFIVNSIVAHNCWGNTHFCDKCHKSGVWQNLAHFRTGKNKKKMWEYENCPSLDPLVKAIGRDSSLSEDQKTDKIGKLLAQPKACPLGVAHPPAGIEFGLGCSMCEDSHSSADKLRETEAAVKAKLSVVKNEILQKGPKTFSYQHDLDQNGLMYYLGTCGKTTTYSNPAEAGFVRVTSSGLMGDSAPLSASVGREVVRCVTTPVRNSWFCFEILEFSLCLTHYTLRHYSSWDTEAVRNWVLEGSNDHTTWEVLCLHVNDQSLNKKGATHTWAVDSRGRKFKFFRVLQNGRNSNNNFYLPISGLEFYGTLYVADQSSGPSSSQPQAQAAAGMSQLPAVPSNRPPPLPLASPEAPSKPFVYHHDLDNNGIIWYLGTRMGTNKNWTNPAEIGLVRVTCSELATQPASAPASAAIGREVVRCVSASKPNMWFCIDFTDSGKRVRPTFYTMRHYLSWDLEALRNWRFEASVNGQDWFVLSVHVNDTALDKKGATHTWAIPGCQGVFSMFRIFQTGFNSNNHHYLALSGFEIYGDLIDVANRPMPQPMVQPIQPMVQQQMPPQGIQPPPLPAQLQPSPQPVGASCGVPFTPKDPSLLQFRYRHDFDENGLFFFLGSFGKRQQWRNPGEAGFVHCQCAQLAINPPSAPTWAIVGREVVRCVSVPKPDMWFSVDLKEKLFSPTEYTLRHYSSWDTEALRNWRFEASLDGNRWDVLCNHINDPSLDKKGASKTWIVTQNPTKLYRLFRIYQTGPNSNSNHYLALSGFEMYGFLQLNLRPNVAPNAVPSPMPQGLRPSSSGIDPSGLPPPPAYPGMGGPPLPPNRPMQSPGPPPYPPNQGVLGPSPPPYPAGSPMGLNPAMGFSPSPRVSSSLPSPPSASLSKSYVEFKEGMDFIYQSDFDDNGIMYWLGTNQYKSPWRNPHDVGGCRVTSVPLAIQPPSEPAQAIVGRSIVRCVTLPNRESWFCIDLVNWYVKPTHYTLRHYDSWDTEALRDWKLQGSNDGKKWTKLIGHKNDQNLNKKGASFTWEIPKVKKPYRMLRILQTGKNSNGHWYCALSGFEVYGKVYSSKDLG